MTTETQQTIRARFFRQLHQSGNPFILANVWDLGGAKMLTANGAAAVATTSAGHAFTLGRPDMGHVTREEMIAHAGQIAESVAAPVSADCENGYGHSPDDVAETVRQAAAAGLAGCSIEDTSLPEMRPYELTDAVARIRAAVSTARECVKEFVITARADGMLTGQYGLEEAIRRLRAFESAGADVLYAPGPPDLDSLARICDSVSAPVNALAAGSFCDCRLADFARIGVARVSLGSSLARLSHAVMLNAAKAMFENGTFAPLKDGADSRQIDSFLCADNTGP